MVFFLAVTFGAAFLGAASSDVVFVRPRRVVRALPAAGAALGEMALAVILVFDRVEAAMVVSGMVAGQCRGRRRDWTAVQALRV